MNSLANSHSPYASPSAAASAATLPQPATLPRPYTAGYCNCKGPSIEVTFFTQEALPELQLTEEVHHQGVSHEVRKRHQMSQTNLLSTFI